MAVELATARAMALLLGALPVRRALAAVVGLAGFIALIIRDHPECFRLVVVVQQVAYGRVDRAQGVDERYEPERIARQRLINELELRLRNLWRAPLLTRV